MRLALFEPEIPPNTGTMLRLCACLGVPVDIVEPCGFPFSDRALRRAGMDYMDFVDLRRHIDFAAFNAWRREAGHRLVLVETTGTLRHIDFGFAPKDILMLGRETSGTPPEVEAACDAVVRIPMLPSARSLNVATAAAMVLSEALRQTGGFPQ
ncbi:tRNA (cytidine(34)-2'-O)-methyltransferase [Pedomonas mirosovicensis]|uniref:tRNA (cytidine(34)-2'-O)-methyltransferase n=1 Tax=Pedomonas mirosovicensis TaxID=2908641 RepID=UPI0021695B04|nr:tRNA (cytidine(34)-2'-O)-methyltransferase [Pedomonas mirosovicensis]MCH8684677.1 tRNA (cytidine(34)-2'-O)-methyltransferase [Pedomonas mirosovicensis]